MAYRETLTQKSLKHFPRVVLCAKWLFWLLYPKGKFLNGLRQVFLKAINVKIHLSSSRKMSHPIMTSRRWWNTFLNSKTSFLYDILLSFPIFFQPNQSYFFVQTNNFCSKLFDFFTKWSFAFSDDFWILNLFWRMELIAIDLKA